MPTEDDNGAPAGDIIQQATRLLDTLRAKIDELMVQLDLADLDVRDELRKRVDTAQNAFLAARSRVDAARRDDGSNLSSLREGLEKVLDDLRSAYQAADGAVRRGGSESPAASGVPLQRAHRHEGLTCALGLHVLRPDRGGTGRSGRD